MYKTTLHAHLGALLLLAVATPLFSQKAPAKFGKITPEELQITHCPFDSAAQAYYLFDFGNTYLEVNDVKGYGIVFYRHFRVKVLGKEGAELANHSIVLFVPGNDNEHVEGLEAISYNLENGQVVKTEMEKSSVFKEKSTKNHRTIKLTVPNVRVGSVFEVKYEVHSDYIFYIEPWTVQHDYPTARSEFHVNTLSDFIYRQDVRGYIPLDVKRENGESRRLPVAGGFVEMREDLLHFTAENVPAFRSEPHLYTDDNYRSTIRFDLAGIMPQAGYPVKIAGNWGEVAGNLMTNEDFGGVLKKKTAFKTEAALLRQRATPLERVQGAFDVVRQHFTWNGAHTTFAEHSASKAYDTRTVGSADINLSLVTLLRELDIEAHPVILNTRNEGVIRPGHVGLRHINHVIVAAVIDSTQYLMDASDAHSAVGLLPPKDCNGTAFAILPEYIQNLDLVQNKIYGFSEKGEVNIQPDGQLQGHLHLRYTDYGGYSRRRQISKKGNADAYFKAWSSELPGLEIGKYTIQGVDSTAEALEMDFDATFSSHTEQAGNLLLVQPWLLDWENENPFKSPNRDYPVEFDYPQVRSSTVKFNLPEGYAVESLPKAIKVRLPDGSAKFNCSATQQGNTVTVNTVLQITRTQFDSSEYLDLRQFFQTVVDKEQEKIVLKKL